MLALSVAGVYNCRVGAFCRAGQVHRIISAMHALLVRCIAVLQCGAAGAGLNDITASLRVLHTLVMQHHHQSGSVIVINATCLGPCLQCMCS
jgi:hypothetical protein